MQIETRKRRMNAIAITAVLLVTPLAVPVGADTGQSQNISSEMSHENHMSQEDKMTDEGLRTVTGTGQINKIAAQHQMLSITHEPIPEMNWPRMKMNFRTSDGVDLSNLKPGQNVQFVMEVDKENNYLIMNIEIIE
ncbi:copper-binding protein [Pseudomonadota bacterium]